MFLFLLSQASWRKDIHLTLAANQPSQVPTSITLPPHGNAATLTQDWVCPVAFPVAPVALLKVSEKLSLPIERGLIDSRLT
jgi:hypothetical protein